MLQTVRTGPPHMLPTPSFIVSNGTAFSASMLSHAPVQLRVTPEPALA
jgi:hypothetical protein